MEMGKEISEKTVAELALVARLDQARQTLRDQFMQAGVDTGPAGVAAWRDKARQSLALGDPVGAMARAQIVFLLRLAGDEPWEACEQMYAPGEEMDELGISLLPGVTPAAAGLDLCQLLIDPRDPMSDLVSIELNLRAALFALADLSKSLQRRVTPLCLLLEEAPWAALAIIDLLRPVCPPERQLVLDAMSNGNPARWVAVALVDVACRHSLGLVADAEIQSLQAAIARTFAGLDGDPI